MVDTTQAHPAPVKLSKIVKISGKSGEGFRKFRNISSQAIAQHWQWIAYQGRTFFIQNDSEWYDSAREHDIQDANSIMTTEDTTGPHGDRDKVIKNLQTPD